MAAEDIASSWEESPYPNQMQVPNMLGHQEWVPPGTTYSTSNPYVTTSHASQAMLTPISISDSVLLDAQHSPPQRHHPDPRYSSIGGIQHGLGITGTSALGYVSAGMPYGSYQRSIMGNIAEEPADHGRERSHMRPTRAPTHTHTPTHTYNPTHTHTPAHTPIHLRTPVTIAPNPAGLRQLEQERQIGQDEQTQRNPRRRRRTRRRSTQLEEETDYAITLRNQGYAWKEVVSRVNYNFSANYTASRLQMRITRRWQRMMKGWSEDDIRALQNAHSYWETEKFEIISQKIQNFGATKRWTPSQCQQKWELLRTHSRALEASPRNMEEEPKPKSENDEDEEHRSKRTRIQ